MTSHSVTCWVDQLAAGNEEAADQLWDFVAERLQNYARQKLEVRMRRHYDEHDVANSAFNSLCRGLMERRIDVTNRGALWGVLAVIAARKVSAKQRYLSRRKRGGGLMVLGESVGGENDIDAIRINDFAGTQHPPDVLAEVKESCDQLLGALPDEQLRKIVLLKLQGSTDNEVAEECSCTRRTIVRKLEKIRRIWTEFSKQNQSDTH